MRRISFAVVRRAASASSTCSPITRRVWPRASRSVFGGSPGRLASVGRSSSFTSSVSTSLSRPSTAASRCSTETAMQVHGAEMDHLEREAVEVAPQHDQTDLAHRHGPEHSQCPYPVISMMRFRSISAGAGP